MGQIGRWHNVSLLTFIRDYEDGISFSELVKKYPHNHSSILKSDLEILESERLIKKEDNKYYVI